MTPSKKHGLFIAVITSLTLTLSACATKPEPRGGPSSDAQKGQQDGRQGKRRPKSSGTFVKPVGLLFTSMDANSDARISKSELSAGIATEWNRFDSAPSAIAFRRWSLENLGSADAKPTFMSFDKNFDGAISKDEFSAQLEQSFTRLDANLDGQLDRSEMIVAFEAQQGRARAQRSESGGQGGGRGGRGGGGRGGRGDGGGGR